ncbi:MAG: hypothetical protein HON90_11175 [Halobacteriovoraceae bacterium]|nr:hypothetical protein [Halobacteriovoraceae bacterium]
MWVTKSKINKLSNAEKQHFTKVLNKKLGGWWKYEIHGTYPIPQDKNELLLHVSYYLKDLRTFDWRKRQDLRQKNGKKRQDSSGAILVGYNKQSGAVALMSSVGSDLGCQFKIMFKDFNNDRNFEALVIRDNYNVNSHYGISYNYKMISLFNKKGYKLLFENLYANVDHVEIPPDRDKSKEFKASLSGLDYIKYPLYITDKNDLRGLKHLSKIFIFYNSTKKVQRIVQWSKVLRANKIAKFELNKEHFTLFEGSIGNNSLFKKLDKTQEEIKGFFLPFQRSWKDGI